MIYDYIILWQGQMKRAIGLCLLCFISNNTSFINLIFSMISKMVPTKGTKNQQYLFGWIGSKWGRVKFRHRRVQKSKQNQNITPNTWNELIHLTHMYSGAQVTAQATTPHTPPPSPHTPSSATSVCSRIHKWPQSMKHVCIYKIFNNFYLSRP